MAVVAGGSGGGSSRGSGTDQGNRGNSANGRNIQHATNSSTVTPNGSTRRAAERIDCKEASPKKLNRSMPADTQAAETAAHHKLNDAYHAAAEELFGCGVEHAQ